VEEMDDIFSGLFFDTNTQQQEDEDGLRGQSDEELQRVNGSATDADWPLDTAVINAISPFFSTTEEDSPDSGSDWF